MRNIIISLILFLGLIPLSVSADSLQLQDKAPDRYVVVPGDTLWGISARFLKYPWKWPEIWGMNRDEIENPQLIYPGDVILLDHVNGVPRLRIEGQASGEQPNPVVPERTTVRLSPEKQIRDLGRAIASIPLSEIGPFLSRTRIVDLEDWEKAPRLVAGGNDSDVLGEGEFAYVEGLNTSKVVSWNIYSKGSKLVDPESGKTLGFEANYIGDARLVEAGSPSKIEITRSVTEIDIGARMLPVSELSVTQFIPHAPDRKILGRIVSSGGDFSEVGQGDIVRLDLGTRNGIELGDVLAVFRKGETIQSDGEKLKLPSERIGLVLVFRTYGTLSYALVVQSERTIHVADTVQTP